MEMDSALTLTRFARGDDADDFFAICVALTIHVHHQQHSRECRSSPMPPLLAVNHPVLHQKQVRVIKYAGFRAQVQPLVLRWVCPSPVWSTRPGLAKNSDFRHSA